MKKLLLAFALLFSSVYGEDYEEDFSEGFEDIEEVVVEKKAKEKEPFLDLDGSFSLFSSYNYNRSDEPFDGLSSLKPSLDLKSDKKLSDTTRVRVRAKASYDGIYAIKGKDKYRDELVDDEEFTADFKEVYINTTLQKNIDLKIGRQIVVWGKSDSLRVTDVINPMDYTKMGLIDIEDLRLELFMTKTSIYFGKWALTPIVIHENRNPKMPAYGSDFNPSPVKTTEETPSNTQYALSLDGEFEGYDVSFYGAKVNNETGHLEGTVRKHEPLTMFGAAYNATEDAWLFKVEGAYLDGFKFQDTGDRTFSRTDLMAGFDYKGIADTTLTLESVVREYGSLDSAQTDKKTLQTAFRASTETLNATLTVNYLISVFGGDFKDGGFQRVWGEYDLGGGLNGTLGIVDYIDDDAENTRFSYIKDNDRIFAEIKQSF